MSHYTLYCESGTNPSDACRTDGSLGGSGSFRAGGCVSAREAVVERWRRRRGVGGEGPEAVAWWGATSRPSASVELGWTKLGPTSRLGSSRSLYEVSTITTWGRTHGQLPSLRLPSGPCPTEDEAPTLVRAQNHPFSPPRLNERAKWLTCYLSYRFIPPMEGLRNIFRGGFIFLIL